MKLVIEGVLLLLKGVWFLSVVVAGLMLLHTTHPQDRLFAWGLAIALALTAAAYAFWLRPWIDARFAPAGAAVPDPPAPGRGGEMFEVLAGLGIPLDTGVSSPQQALGGALDKSSVYAAYRHLAAGRGAEALALLEEMLEDPGLDPRVAGVCHFLSAGASQQLGRLPQAVASLVRARELYPGNPRIEDAYRKLVAPPAGGPPPGHSYSPSLEGAVEVKRVPVDEAHEGVLRRHPPAAEQSSTVKYLYTLAVHPGAGGPAVLYVASELNRSYDPSRPPQERTGSHFLGLFSGQGHATVDCSDEWADLDRFLERALELARERAALRRA